MFDRWFARSTRRAAGTAAAIVLTLSGCATPLPPAAPPSPPPALADYARTVQSFDAATLLSEQNRLASVDTATAVLQRALVMAAPGNPMRDDAAAAALARGVARSDAQPVLREAGAWVALWIDEQARIEARQERIDDHAVEAERRLEQMEQRLRETEKRLAEADRRSLDAERRGIDAERRALAAERKLDALRLIERDLSSRPPDERR